MMYRGKDELYCVECAPMVRELGGTQPWADRPKKDH